MRDLGDRFAEANALCHLGEARQATGDYPAAGQLLEQALAIFGDIGDRLGQAFALLDLGVLRRETDDYLAVGQVLDKALSISRELDDRASESWTLNENGTLHRVTGDLAQAEDSHQQGLEIFQRIGAVEAADVAVELDAATQAQSAAPGS